jgi:predicted dehydrogenase
MNNHIFKWGILGPGRIAKQFAKGVDSIDNSEIYAVASNDQERAALFADEFNVPNSYSTYSDLVNDPMVDAVYIATPHRFHFEQTKLCLEAKKPVLCEKPFTVNVEECKKLIEMAKEKKVFLMEGLWTRFLPIYRVIWSWINNGEIGDIKLLNSTFGISPQKDPEDRKFNHELAGGALLDLGIYQISLSQWLLNRNPLKISAEALIGDTNVDELTAANLVYENGVVSQFNCNLLSQNENNFLIYGNKGSIRIHADYWKGTTATLIKNGENITEKASFRSTGFEYEAEEVMNCVLQGKLESVVMPLDQTLANIEVMDKIREIIGLKYNFE